MKNFNVDDQIVTERLVLRSLKNEDALAIFHNVNHDEKVLAYYIAPYIEKQEDASVKRIIDYYIDKQMYCMAIVLKEKNEVIGMINQVDEVEVGYAIGSSYWNNGYGSEALQAFIGFLFSKGNQKVICGHIEENIGSRRVMEKSGMTFLEKRENELDYHGKKWDVYYYIKENK